MPTVKQHVENMTKLIERVGYNSQREVMADFVEMGAIAMSNAVDRRMFSEREPKYLISMPSTNESINSSSVSC